MKQQIANLQAEINNLRNNNAEASLKQQINNYILEINNYKTIISRLEGQINESKTASSELGALRHQINIYVSEINNYKQQITRL